MLAFHYQELHRSFASTRLVLETLGPLPGDRKCFRMINGVLVERTVKDVIPALQTNSEGLKKVLVELVKQYKRQEEEMEKWKVSQTSCPVPPIWNEDSCSKGFRDTLTPR